MNPDCTSKSARFIGALFLAFALTEVSAAEVAQPSVTTAEIGLSVLRFDYTEYKDNGSTWNRELGGIPGMSFRLTQRYSSWEWEGVASYHHGRVAYTGQTSLGIPHNSHTDEEVGDIALRLGRWFGGSYPVMPYAGLGYRQWDRDIGVLFESYRWKYAWLGAKIMAHQRRASIFMLDIGWIKPLDPEMHVNVYNVSLSPESRDGLRLMLTSYMSLSKNTTLMLEPYYEYWELGRSPSIVNGRFIIYEPASKTTNLGFNSRLGRKF